MSEHRPGAAGSPAAALRALNSAAQAARIAWRWTIAYTQPAAPRRGAPADSRRTGPGPWSRAFRPLLAVAARPGLWLANLLFVARHGPEVVAVGAAAACVPNPVRRRRRTLWPVLGPVVATAVVAPLVVATLLLVVARGSLTGRAAAASGLMVVVGAGIGALLLAVAHLGLDRRGAMPDRLLHRYVAQMERETGSPVVAGPRAARGRAAPATAPHC